MKLRIQRIRNELDLESGQYLNVLVVTDGRAVCEVPVSDSVFTQLMSTFRDGIENLENPANDSAPTYVPDDPEDSEEAIAHNHDYAPGDEPDPLALDVDFDEDVGLDDEGWVVVDDEEEGDA